MRNNNGHKARILIADDESSVRDIISLRLAQEGHNCTAVPDGNSALRTLDGCEFDLAVLDIKMPGKSGIDVLREMQVSCPDTAGIMVTGMGDIQTAIESMKMGAYDYIMKPVNLSMLMTCVDGALDKRTLILENKNYQLHLEEKVKEQTDKIRSSFLNSITSLAYALEAKDKYTSGHSQRVAEMAVATAREMGMPEDKVARIELAGLVHDIGKIGVRESVLNKAGKLTDDEYHEIISHPEIGERILSPILEDEEMLKMVRHHHERYDGTGYPDGLSGKRIPEAARVLAVADAYDAMTSDRPYRAAMSSVMACAELEEGKRKQFDPVVVDAFLSCVEYQRSPIKMTAAT